ncbi:MAG: aconitase X catalytic domain-containing protein [Candidatus Hadarchaeia archaeon]
MYLNKKQESMLSGEDGEAIRKAMEILVALGDIYQAERLIPIKSAHLSGVSIKTAGEAGLDFIEEMADLGAKAKVKTTINPAGIDLDNWKSMNAPKNFSNKQIQMIEAYKKIGAEPTCSCIPYYINNKPSFGDHIAWAESSAVVYSNSVLGARTNREGAPSALASAITGLTPLHGYHKDENRKGTVRIEVDNKIPQNGETFPYSVLGYWIGKEFPNDVPVIEGIKPNKSQKKALGAGLATSGAIALFHIPDETPEAKRNPELCKTNKRVTYGRNEAEKVVEELDQTKDVDLIWLGCPHATIDEVKRVIERSSGERKAWICVPRKFKERLESGNLSEKIEEKGFKLIYDSCMVVSPLAEMGISSIGVNSAKAAKYAPSLANVKVHFAPLKELIK